MERGRCGLDGMVLPQPGGVPGLPLSREGISLCRQMNGLLQSMVLKPEENGGSVLGQLRELLTAQLPRLKPAEISAQPGRGRNPEMEAPGNGSHAARGDRVPAFSEFLEKFSRLLQELREAAKAVGSSREGRRMVTEREKLERQMAGCQIVQSFMQEGQNQDDLYFSLPFIQTAAGETWGQLRITRDAAAKKPGELSRFKVDIFLRTKNLGPLLLGITVLNKDVLASGKATEEQAVRRIMEAWPRLQDTFAAMGYRLRRKSFRLPGSPRYLFSQTQFLSICFQTSTSIQRYRRNCTRWWRRCLFSFTHWTMPEIRNNFDFCF